MQLVTRATSIAAVALASLSMLMQIATAVEVTSEPLPQSPQAPETGQHPVERSAPPSSDCFVLGSRSFSIPFSVDSSGARPVEVHLFVSSGPEDGWRLLDRRSPDLPQRQFQFEADRDGEFWFATRTLDSLGRLHPTGEIESQLRVYVDTTKPRATMLADADADGQIDVTVSIHDATTVRETKLRYVTDLNKDWVDVDMRNLSPEGKLQFSTSEPWKQLSIQLIVTDTPGNQSVVNQLLRRPRFAESLNRRYAGLAGKGSTEATALPYRIDASDRLAALAVSNPVIQLDRHQTPPPSNVTSANGYASESLPWQSVPSHGFRGAQTPLPSPSNMALAPPPNLIPAPPQAPGRGVQAQVAGSTAGFLPAVQSTSPPPASLFDRLFGTTVSPIPAGASGPAGSPPRFASNVEDELPAPATPAQISNGFGLNSPGQSEPETVPLPGNPMPDATPPRPRPRTPAEAMRPITDPSQLSTATQEEIPTPAGEPDSYRSMRSTVAPTPSPLATDEVAGMIQRAPVRYSDRERFSLDYELEAVGALGVEAIELYGSTDGGRSWQLWGSDPDRNSPFDIETKEAGVFGFRIVVVGANGLASPRPLAGEAPDIVVVVDKDRPVVRITGAQYGERDQVGSLVIRYECEDANLKPRPIALSFSDRVDGPWTTIVAGLRNDGEYVWKADPNLPRQLHLRIDATDLAGNAGSYVLDQPIDAQGLAPRARIRGLQSSLESGQFNGDGQTAKRPPGLFK